MCVLVELVACTLLRKQQVSKHKTIKVARTGFKKKQQNKSVQCTAMAALIGGHTYYRKPTPQKYVAGSPFA